MQKHANLVDLVKSFPTNIYLQNLALIQPRTSLSKFVKFSHRYHARRCRFPGSGRRARACPAAVVLHLPLERYVWSSGTDLTALHVCTVGVLNELKLNNIIEKSSISDVAFSCCCMVDGGSPEFRVACPLLMSLHSPHAPAFFYSCDFA